MANKLDTIEVVGEYKHLQIREIADSGEYYRRVISPNMAVSGEVQEIKDKAEELWTDEVKTAFSEFKAEQQSYYENEKSKQEAKRLAEQKAKE